MATFSIFAAFCLISLSLHPGHFASGVILPSTVRKASKENGLSNNLLEGCRLHLASSSHGVVDVCDDGRSFIHTFFGDGMCPREDLHLLMKQIGANPAAEKTALIEQHSPMKPHIWAQWVKAFTAHPWAPAGPGWQTLHERGVYLLKNFLSTEEADQAVSVTQSTSPSKSAIIYGKNAACTFRQSKQYNTRELPFDLSQRMESTVGIQKNKEEPLMLTRYDKGDFYSAHLDWGPCSHHANGARVDSFEQVLSKVTWEPRVCEHSARIGTMLIYLTDAIDGGGGATYFPNLNLRVLPEKGSAIFFRPTDTRGESDPAMLHSAEMVTKGTKVVLQQWFDGYR